MLTVSALVVGLAVLHLVNYLRLDAGALAESSERVLAEARELQDRAQPEYQEVALAAMRPNPRTGEYLRLDDALDRAKVNLEPAAGPPGEDVIAALEFDDPHRPELAAAAGRLKISTGEGTLSVVSDPEDYLINAVALDVPRDDVGEILIRMRADQGSYLRLGWAPAGGRADGQMWHDILDLRFRGHGEFQTYIVNARTVLSRGLAPGESLGQLYLQVSDVPGATVEIDFIRFISKTARYMASARGREYEGKAGELRPVLFMRPEQELEFPVRVPARQPRLDLGMGVLLEGRALRFGVTIVRPDGHAEPLQDVEVRSASEWRDARIDLARFAGEEVKLRLHVSGDPANVGFWSSPTLSGTPPDRFNVIVLVEDAQRADHLSLYGYASDTTPFKKRLGAERGIVFEQAVSQATKTRPSAAAYMTGLYPTANGLWHFSDVLSDRHLTLAEILRAQGYVTASFLQNGNVGPFAGLHQGFDRVTDLSPEGSTTEVAFNGEAVTRWLNAHSDRNFFLYLHAIDPHAPYDPVSPFREQYAAEAPTDGTPVKRSRFYDAPWVEKPSMELRRKLYDAEIAHNDRVVGEFFRRLDQSGLASSTLVVLMSDHGEHLGERGPFGNRMWDHRPPGLLTTTHVPLMLVHPSRFPHPKRIAAPVQLIDLMPTVLDLAGVDREGLLIQGHPLTGLIDGSEPERWRDRVIVSEEPTAMNKGDPCRCGSTYFRDWHLLSSTWVWPRQHLYAPGLQTFLGTFVTKVNAPSSEELDYGFAPDLVVRSRQQAFLGDLRDINMDIWRRLTEQEADGRVIDPDTLERLRGLGYVN
ncbi:MAG: sulfatase [Geminicoccaceae bacterium]